LYRATGDERYKRAAFLLREQLRGHPRTRERGFWHKKIYPYQMWLDGIYMASPFLAEFAATFPPVSETGEGWGGGVFDDVAHQIILIEQHTRDPKTGLLYHGWDESRQQRWANPATGCSPHFWGRAMGWYAMAIVDVLDYLPTDHAQHPAILAIFERMIDALAKVQDQASGLWYQVLDNPSPSVIASREAAKQSPTSELEIASHPSTSLRMLATLAPHASAGVTPPGNYLEASASCMFVYAIAKAVRKNYLAAGYLGIAQKAYRGILGNLIEIDERGLVNLNGTCGGAGLGGNPYRDGSYEYYVGEKIIVNDYKGVGPFILASIEIESL
jgi:unsaturated rhamnogalacturonyl hydrolase